MRENTFLLLLFLYLMVILCASEKLQPCGPSSCGNISTITYPFRLKDDPQHCGDPRFQLSCQNNTTFIYFSSVKYRVVEIDYANYTFRIVDAAITNDVCSLPNYSLPLSHFRRNFLQSVRYYWPPDSIIVLNCPNPVVNNSGFVGPIHCGSMVKYIKDGFLSVSDPILDKCAIQLILPYVNNNSIGYGFLLSWVPILCGDDCLDCVLNGTTPTCRYSNSCCYRLLYWRKYAIDLCPHDSSDRSFVMRLLGGFEIRKIGQDEMNSDRHCTSSAVYHIIWMVLDAVVIVIASILLRMLIGIPSMLGFVLYKLGRRHLSMFEAIEDFLQNNHLMPIRYSYSNIKSITRSFKQKLGEGGYGCVYKGKLRSGHDVAVKVLNKPKANGQDFINEVATIGRIHHVNVVKLVGYCVDGSKCALIYDFMSNGSLEKYIFGQDRKISLCWKKKYEIAIGVARGIEYLHLGCDIQILHFDIKPHNILLSEDFTPKISDFGLAKLYSNEDNTITLTAARGTIGYVAPELINRSIGRVSHKADVYSYGMLLMEMIGVKDMVLDDKKSSQYFPCWVYDHLNADKDIEIECDKEDDEEYGKEIARRMTIVGLWCIQMNPVDRPSMNEVVKMLEGDGKNVQIPPQPVSLGAEFISSITESDEESGGL